MECLPVLFHALLLCLSLIVSSLPGSCVDAGDENFVFSGFAGAGAGNLTLGDAAKVTPEGLLQLTNNTETTKGNAFYPTPLRFKDYSSSPNGTARSFSAAFVFAIVSAYGEEASTDGMAFLIAPTTDLSDAGWSQYMGFLDGAAMDRTFAVELDTYKNAELRDIDSNHAGVHVGGLFSTDSHAAAFHDDSNGGGALTGLSLDSGEAMQAWVDYDGKSKRVNVTLAPMGVAKPSTPLLSDVSDDLSAVLTERAYVGFSAATGPIKTRHYVLAWSFAMDGPAPPIDFTKMPKLPRSGRSNKTFKTMALPIIAAASALVLLAACSITLLRRRLKYAELREDWEVLLQGSVPRDGRVQEQQHPRRGGFGKVYKGVLPKSRSEVAVKRVSHESSQGIKEFISEVVSIGHLRHRNLVVGYCRRKGELLLVSGADPQGGQGGPPTPLTLPHAAHSSKAQPTPAQHRPKTRHCRLHTKRKSHGLAGAGSPPSPNANLAARRRRHAIGPTHEWILDSGMHHRHHLHQSYRWVRHCLVYEYMPNGSLDRYLYGGDDKPVLGWAHRFQIIKDVASAVFYLHEKWEQVVIHRDIKASNVLLDGGMTAHLGDFGLARLHDHGADLQATTHVVGTMGYIAPELARTGRASPLTDVFAFGVFLLEVACGRQPVSNGGVRHGRRTLLVDRVLEYWRAGELLETVDARLRGGYDPDEARLVLTLGLMCSHPFPGERPAMRQVVQCLDGDAPLPELTPADLSLLRMMQNEGLFDRRCLWSSENSIGTMSIDISVGR
ncbi:hypothetical protein HU200_007951 [Digitaria exilis]|uniref:non-specific serine/threonine protein kinase n=1 Tax=Digitaria exilis TaxID=1010633 RepID=A0A835FMI4_9POAL|nr:hypothetical protein HU200_007951 [Digitaria exilis]